MYLAAARNNAAVSPHGSFIGTVGESELKNGTTTRGENRAHLRKSQIKENKRSGFNGNG